MQVINSVWNTFANITSRKNKVAPCQEFAFPPPVPVSARHIVNDVHYFKRASEPGNADRLLDDLNAAITHPMKDSGEDKFRLVEADPRALTELKTNSGILAQALSLGCRTSFPGQDNRPTHTLAREVLGRLDGMRLTDGFDISGKRPDQKDEYAWRTVLQLGTSTEGSKLLRRVCYWPDAGMPEGYAQHPPFALYLKVARDLIARCPALPAHPAMLIKALNADKASGVKISKILGAEEMEKAKKALSMVQGMINAEGRANRQNMSDKELLSLRKISQGITAEHEDIFNRVLETLPGYLKNSAEAESKLDAAIDGIAKIKSRPLEGLKIKNAIPAKATESEILDALRKMVSGMKKGEKLSFVSDKNKNINVNFFKFILTNGWTKVFPILGVVLETGVSIRVEHTETRMRLTIVREENRRGELGGGAKGGVGSGTDTVRLGASVTAKARLLECAKSKKTEVHLELPALNEKDEGVFNAILADVFGEARTVNELLEKYPRLRISGNGHESSRVMAGGEISGFAGAKFIVPGADDHLTLGVGVGGAIALRGGKTDRRELANNSTKTKEVKYAKLARESFSSTKTSTNVFTWELDKNAEIGGEIFAKADNADLTLAGTGKALASSGTEQKPATITWNEGRITKVKAEERVKNKQALISDELNAVSRPPFEIRGNNAQMTPKSLSRERARCELQILQLAKDGAEIKAQQFLGKTQIDLANQYLSLAAQAKLAKHYKDAGRYEAAANVILDQVHSKPVTRYVAVEAKTHTDKLAMNFTNPVTKKKEEFLLRKALPLQVSRENTLKETRKIVYEPMPKEPGSSGQIKHESQESVRKNIYKPRTKKADLTHAK